MTMQGQEFLAAGWVPHPYDIVEERRSETFTVRAPCQPVHHRGLIAQNEHLAPGGRVPDSNSLVGITRAGETCSIGTEAYPAHWPCMAAHAQFLRTNRAPNSDSTTVIGGSYAGAVGTEREVPNTAPGCIHGQGFLAGGHVPDRDHVREDTGSFDSGCGEAFAVGAEGQCSGLCASGTGDGRKEVRPRPDR